jgi:hypothetical protein
VKERDRSGDSVEVDRPRLPKREDVVDDAVSAEHPFDLAGDEQVLEFDFRRSETRGRNELFHP